MQRLPGRTSLPSPTSPLLRCVLYVVALLTLALPVAAQPASGIESLRSLVETSTLDATQREAALNQLNSAAAHMRSADEFRQQAASLQAVAARRAAEIDDAGSQPVLDPEESLEEWVARLPSDADVEALERMLQQHRATLDERTTEIARLEALLDETLARPADIPGEIAALGREAENLATPLVSVEGEPELLRDARALARMSELEQVQAELELRRIEQQTSLARQRLYESQLEELRTRQALDARRAEWLEERVADLSREELQRAASRLVEPETPDDVEEGTDEGSSTTNPDSKRPGADSSLAASLAEENRELGDELLAQNSRLEEDRQEVSEEEEARDDVTTALRESRTRLALGGSSEAVGRWLWSERRRLERSVRLQSQLEDRRSELAELRLRLVTLSEEQRELDNLPAAARKLREANRTEADDEDEAIAADETLIPFLERRLELLGLLEPILERRISALEQGELVLQETLEATQAMRQLLDRHLLWTPSHAPIDATWLERAPDGLSDLVKASRWATTMRLTAEELAERPLVWIACLLALIALIELRRRAPARIRSWDEPTRRVETDRIGATLMAFGWTVAAALPLPVAFALIGQLLQTAGSAGRYSDSVGRACSTIVIPLLAVQVMRWATIDGGLGDAHLGWQAGRRAALRRALSRAAPIVIPASFITNLAFIRNLDLPNDVQARAAVVVACAALGWTFWRSLDVGRIWLRRGSDGESSSIRRLLRLVLPLSTAVVAVLSLTGYVYTAGILLDALVMSICMVIAIALGVGLLGRWFLIGERRLATRRNEEARQAAQEANTAPASETSETDLTLEQLNAQTQRLLVVLRVSLLFFGFIWVWADVLPAVTRLDEIALWTFSDVAEDGTPVAGAVTLMGALFGVVALVLTIISARNVPGLVELGLLSQTNIDAASRYAITSILRYTIVIAGTVVGLELLGMRWSQLQWLAAALTVGLGFGLQEIFANFVSGLILLFERPFRVGDVITVDNLTGRVTRIRTRATTILDFDNREIVVPNKNFITGQLLNWTLSDTSTRVTIKVGVAYGTDPEIVDRLLLEVADAHPKVQREPAPVSWFLAFGASSLDFELRVFVGTLADRLEVQSQLHRAVARAFAENDIEIAFPQMDLHVRDMPEPARAT